MQLIYFELIRYDIGQEYIRTCENNINGVSTNSERTNLHDYRNSSDHVTMVKLEYKCTTFFFLYHPENLKQEVQQLIQYASCGNVSEEFPKLRAIFIAYQYFHG
jgi:hypothetical protein